MYLLKQSTASQEVPLGYFLDSTDGNTEETGLTINASDIKLHKAGATTLANKNSGGGTHISNGIYYAVLDATDTDTLGPLVIFVHVSGALCVRLECLVVTAAQYDVLVGTTTPLTGNAIADAVMTRQTSAFEASVKAAPKCLGAAVMGAVHQTRDNAGTLQIADSAGNFAGTNAISRSITVDANNDPIDELGALS